MAQRIGVADTARVDNRLFGGVFAPPVKTQRIGLGLFVVGAVGTIENKIGGQVQQETILLPTRLHQVLHGLDVLGPAGFFLALALIHVGHGGGMNHHVGFGQFQYFVDLCSIGDVQRVVLVPFDKR